MSYKAIVYALGPVSPHPNADRVRLTSVQGLQVVVGLDAKEGDLGVYFPSDGQLSHEFCSANNLYRDKAMNADPGASPGMFDANRRVRAQRFRGELSDGFWLPVASLAAVGADVSFLSHGMEIDEVGGRELCRKYVNEATLRAASGGAAGKRQRAARTSAMFKEHFDTPHVGRDLSRVGRSSVLYVTEKLHGTSFRVGHVLVERGLSWVERIARWAGARVETEEWSHLNGSRRVVLEESTGEGYHDPSIRQAAFELFRGKLRKGETVYGEIVGYEPSGKAIMGGVAVRRKEHPDLHALYGDEMSYSYGCEPGHSRAYVYRITLTTPCGHSVDLSWEAVKARCAELGVPHVPELARVACSSIRTGYVVIAGDTVSHEGNEEYPSERAEFEARLLERLTALAQGPSTLDARHLREGVCVRCDDHPGYTGKLKSHDFKVLEGLVKDAGVVDMEEAA